MRLSMEAHPLSGCYHIDADFYTETHTQETKQSSQVSERKKYRNTKRLT